MGLSQAVLVVMNPRRITECIEGIKGCRIDKLWIENTWEREIADRWDEVLDLTAAYERIFLISDDAIPHTYQIEMLSELLDRGHPVVTGYSNLSVADMRVNLTKGPLGDVPTVDAYDFYSLAEIQEFPREVVPTTVVGFSLTGMSREMWTRFPFQVQPESGCQSDYNLAKRLERAGIPMVAHRDVFVWHVKQVWNQGDTDPRKRLLIGVEPKGLRFERGVW